MFCSAISQSHPIHTLRRNLGKHFYGPFSKCTFYSILNVCLLRPIFPVQNEICVLNMFVMPNSHQTLFNNTLL